MATELNLMDKWKDLNWKQIERSLFKLQKRIYQAYTQVCMTNTKLSRSRVSGKLSSTVLKPSRSGDTPA